MYFIKNYFLQNPFNTLDVDNKYQDMDFGR